MNTILFLSGAGVGALTATILMLFLMHKASRKQSEINEEVRAGNKRNLEALERRNDLSASQVSFLGMISDTLTDIKNQNK